MPASVRPFADVARGRSRRARGRSRRPCRPAGGRRGRRPRPRAGAGACPPTTDRVSRSSARKVSGPQVPSGLTPTLRWNSRRACAVSGPKMPSTRPQLKPRSSRRCCSAATSSPRSRRLTWWESTRSPSRQRASSSASEVSRPTMPSTLSPRCCWKWRDRAVAGVVERPPRRGVGARASGASGSRSARIGQLVPGHLGAPSAAAHVTLDGAPDGRRRPDGRSRRRGRALLHVSRSDVLGRGPCRIIGFGLAPMICLTTSPPLYTFIVGIETTPYLAAVCGFSSTLSLTMRDLAGVLGRDLLEDRGDLAARSAPRRPEVDEHGHVGVQTSASKDWSVSGCDRAHGGSPWSGRPHLGWSDHWCGRRSGRRPYSAAAR